VEPSKRYVRCKSRCRGRAALKLSGLLTRCEVNLSQKKVGIAAQCRSTSCDCLRKPKSHRCLGNGGGGLGFVPS
jgi:hypothetical protein